MSEIKEIIQRVRENGQVSNHKSQTLQKKSTQQALYKCPICKDTGIIIENVDGSQPIMYKCKCQEVERSKKLWKASGINLEQSNQTFNSYKVFNDITKLAKNTALQYYNNFEDIKRLRHNSIAFIGQVGSGKTHLSIALAINFLKNRKVPVVYMPYRDVITSIKQNMLDKEYYIKKLSKYQTAKILLIDDLFKGKVNETDINIMFEIINYRYLNYLPIIVSSEFTLDKLLNFDEAVGSRIYEMCKDYTVEIVGKENNYRLRA